MARGVFRNSFNQRSGPALWHDGHRGHASEPYVLDDYESGEELICRTVHCECGSTFTAFIGEFYEDRFDKVPMQDHHYIVTVRARNKTEADVVINNRLGPDEDYGFPYDLDYVPDVHWFASVWDEGYRKGALDGFLDDGTQPDNPYRGSDG